MRLIALIASRSSIDKSLALIATERVGLSIALLSIALIETPNREDSCLCI